MEIKNVDRIPLNGTFELTARCNLQCKMCLIRIDNKRMKKLGGRERTADEWIHMAQEIQEAGTIGLLLTGGEPMLRPDFINIYKEIAQMGFILTLYTNATLITSEIMEVLNEYPPHRIGVTVYGASPETYERVTGSTDAYYNMIKGVELLRKLPSKLTIRSTLIKDNIEDLDRIAQWASSFGVEFNLSRIVTKPVRGGIANVEECRLSPEENVTMLKSRNIEGIVKPFYKFVQEYPQILNAKMEQNPFDNNEYIISDKEKYGTKKNKQTLYGCEAGMSSYCITWDGKIVGCQMLGDSWTYPFEEGFEKAWNDFPTKVKCFSIPIQCRNCNTTCSACPATRLAETGCSEGYSEYLCHESRLVEIMEDSLMEEIKENIMRMEG